MEYEGRAMSEKIPQTVEEIESAITEPFQYDIFPDKLAKEIVRWREAWLRDAEPRLRPASEAPQTRDMVVRVFERFPPAVGQWSSADELGPYCTGWYLLKRASIPLTHEQALRLLVSDIRSLGEPPEQLLVALAKAEEALARGTL